MRVVQLGTMTTDIAGAVKQAKMGQIEFRADKTAIVHAPVGKVCAYVCVCVCVCVCVGG
jgi:ribosomal protein L1